MLRLNQIRTAPFKALCQYVYGFCAMNGEIGNQASLLLVCYYNLLRTGGSFCN